MFLYIDALFNLKGPINTKLNYTDAVTTDTSGVRNIPPYMLIPKTVMITTSVGEIRIFDSEDPKSLLHELGDYIENDDDVKKYGVCLIGWYLDQVLIPAICANSMVYGVKTLPEYLRKLNDKWSKPAGYSLERAFLQGWYPEDRNAQYDQLTMHDALEMCGMPSLKENEASIVDNTMPEGHKILAARILALNNLFHRYCDIGPGGQC